MGYLPKIGQPFPPPKNVLLGLEPKLLDFWGTHHGPRVFIDGILKVNYDASFMIEFANNC